MAVGQTGIVEQSRRRDAVYVQEVADALGINKAFHVASIGPSRAQRKGSKPGPSKGLDRDPIAPSSVVGSLSATRITLQFVKHSSFDCQLAI